jgi:hypothetical protein
MADSTLLEGAVFQRAVNVAPDRRRVNVSQEKTVSAPEEGRRSGRLVSADILGLARTIFP